MFASPSVAQTFSDPDFVGETVITMSPYAPIGFAFAPDGRIFIWQKTGIVKIWKNGAVLSKSFIDISSRVNRAGDRGLIGLALDPNFSQNGYVYLAYVYENQGAPTSDQPRTQRVTRVQADPSNPDVALAGSEKVILGSVTSPTCSAGSDCMVNDMGAHTIDHLAFGPDGKLFVSVGEGSTYKEANLNAFRAQDLNNLNGKLLRINKDGTAPGDNPFSDGTNSNKSKVYSFGLRNAFRFAIHPSTGEPFIGDVGWTLFEEVDKGRGANFGWPCFEGPNPQPTYQSKYSQCRSMDPAAVKKPLWSYDRNTGSTVVVGGFYNGSQYPAEYKGNLFVTDYANKWIRRLIFDSAGALVSVNVFATGLVDPVYMTMGPDGMIYYSAFSEGKIRRIRYTGNSNKAPIAVATASPVSGYSPLTVNFSSAGSKDPDGDSLTYLWDFGDGTTSTSANPSHTYQNTGQKSYTALLKVTDSQDLTGTSDVRITVGSLPPQATISKPADGAVVRPGDVVQYAGFATDPDDGNIPSTSLAWTVFLLHNTHKHVLPGSTGSSGSITIGEHDSIDSYSYEINLTATDTSGLTDTATVVLPVNTSSTSLCTLSSTNPSVTICTPGQNATVSSPVRVVAGTTDSSSVTTMKIYVDGKSVYSVNANKLDTSLSMNAGSHLLVVQAWDSAGRVFNASRNITVGTSSGGTTGCTPNTTSPSVKICAPANNATVASPVNVVAVTTSPTPVTTMKIYVDNVSVYSVAAAQLNTNLAMASGTHRVTVQAWNSGGQVFNSVINITVSGSSTGGTSPCTMSTTDPSVTICAPTQGASVASPVRVLAGTTDSSTVTAMKVYVDNQAVYSTSSRSIDTSLGLSAGGHTLVVQAWDQAGRVFNSSRNITVTSSSITGCTANKIDATVTICSPSQGATITGAVQVSAAAYSVNPISAMKVYVDGSVKYSVNAASLNTSLSLAKGTRYIVVQAWDSKGRVFSSNRTVTVQ